jgi:L-threonylcarbamoyladenylate synthase
MEQKQIIEAVNAGKIFIYPTDTIYGLGCNAFDKKAVEKIKEIKLRDKEKPLSIIAPSLEWIDKHCLLDIDINKYLPGPYTIILKKKEKNFLEWVSNTDSLGIRIPNNDFCRKIQKSGVPFITTSVNLSGERPITNISQISQEIRAKVDFIINEGELDGKPSTLVIGGKEIKRDS